MRYLADIAILFVVILGHGHVNSQIIAPEIEYDSQIHRESLR